MKKMKIRGTQKMEKIKSKGRKALSSIAALSRKLRQNSAIAACFLMAILLISLGFYLYPPPDPALEYYHSGLVRYEWFKANEQFMPEYVSSAIESFLKAAANTDSPLVKSWSFYNVGTMLGEIAQDEEMPIEVRIEVIKEAIRYLQAAIALDPDNYDAKYNLEFLINLQKQLMQQLAESESIEEGEEEIEPDELLPELDEQEEEEGF